MEYGAKLVSVIVPAYESPAYLNQAVQSVCSQTWKNYELIVVDDGSSEKCVAQYELPASARLIRHESNRGAGAARNTGIRAAHGEYLALMDHDDIWLPRKLEAQVAALEANPNAALAYCGCTTVDKDLRPRSVVGWKDDPPTSDPVRLLLDRCFIRTCSAVMLRRSALEDVGEFDESLTGTDDHDFYLRFALRHGMVFIPEPLVLYRTHSAQYTRRMAKICGSRVRTVARSLPRIRRYRPDLIRDARRWMSVSQQRYAHALMHYERAPSAATKALLSGLIAWPMNARIYGRLACLPFTVLRCLVKRSLDSKRA